VSERVSIVLDVDTGVDDACALLLAALHPSLDLRAVTCVDGNVGVDQVVRNTLTVLATAGRSDVPVARGAARPLLEPTREARHVHGQDGLGDLDHTALRLPAVTAELDRRHAVELLRDVLLDAADTGEPVTLVPTAPLTNVALLLRTYPEVAHGLRRILFMGGSAATGNATASAEFNVWHDPEAAAVVLDAAHELGIPLTMYGLDVFYDVRVTRADARELLGGKHPASRLAGALVDFQCDRFGSDDATIGDAGAVCAVVDPDGLTTVCRTVHVELTGTRTRGQTVVDRCTWAGDLEHGPHEPSPALVDVALSVDGARWRSLWLDMLRGAGKLV
jgi:pyrimidine-specific ribonucleoside hydrolase